MDSRMNTNRLIMAEHITTHRALQGEELRAALVWRMQEFLEAVYGSADRWFMLTIDGWDLTEEGREGILPKNRVLDLAKWLESVAAAEREAGSIVISRPR